MSAFELLLIKFYPNETHIVGFLQGNLIPTQKDAFNNQQLNTYIII